jgi:divalent metal cation (Fe/Co/Zn/Cd) transporter
LGEAATTKNVAAIRQAIESHPNVVGVVELLTMHLAPKQILVNAHINLKDDLANAEVIQTIADVEESMKKAEPKVDMIFLKTASPNNTSSEEMNPKHIG